MQASIDRTALGLFSPVAPTYERWARVLSLGQDSRWRAEMVARLDLPAGADVLDVASGTRSIERLLGLRGMRVVGLDLCFEMLASGSPPQAAVVCAKAEEAPFAAASFDCLTFGYLLRYVSDPLSCLRELCRVVRPVAGWRQHVGRLPKGPVRRLWLPPG